MPYPITNYNIDLYFYDLANRIVSLYYMRFISPNFITYINCCISVYLFLNYTLNTELNSSLIILIFIRTFLDILDGSLARYYNKITEYGQNLDCWCDRIFSLAMLFWSICIKRNLNIYSLVVMSSFFLYYTNSFVYLIIHDNTMLFMPLTFFLIW